MDGKSVDRIISGINKIRTIQPQLDKILFDEFYTLDYEYVKKIESETNIKVLNGRKALVELLNYLIKEFCKYNNIAINEQDFLIISDDTTYTKKITLELAKKSRFITLKSEDYNFVDKLSDKVLNETGLSIHITDNLKRNLKQYKFIINLRENVEINITSINRKTIVFDCSLDKKISQVMRKKRRNILVVNDVIFCNPNNVYCDKSENSLKKNITSNLYLYLKNSIEDKDMKKIKIGNSHYTIEEASELFLNSNKSISNFLVKK